MIYWSTSTRDARDFLKHHKRLDVAVDAYFSNPNAFAGRRKTETDGTPSIIRLEEIYNKYKGQTLISVGFFI